MSGPAEELSKNRKVFHYDCFNLLDLADHQVPEQLLAFIFPKTIRGVH